MNFSWIYGVFLCGLGIYLLLPLPPGHLSMREHSLRWKNTLQQWRYLHCFAMLVVCTIAVIVAMVSPWFLATLAVCAGTGVRLWNSEKQRTRDKELVSLVMGTTYQLHNLLKSGQLIIPALRTIRASTVDSQFSHKLEELTKSLYNNALSSQIIPSPTEKTDYPRFSQLWTYMYKILFLGVEQGIAMLVLTDSFIQCMEQIIAAEDKVLASAAGAKMSAVFLAALPLVGLGLGTLLGATPWEVLCHSSIGSILVLVGMSCVCLGLLWSQKIIHKAVDVA